MILRRIDPFSLAKILGLLYAILGFLFGGFVSLAVLAGSIGSDLERDEFSGLLLGAGAVVFIPALYGTMGFLGGLLVGFLYNVVSRVVGGLKIELVPESESP